MGILYIINQFDNFFSYNSTNYLYQAKKFQKPLDKSCFLLYNKYVRLRDTRNYFGGNVYEIFQEYQISRRTQESL